MCSAGAETSPEAFLHAFAPAGAGRHGPSPRAVEARQRRHWPASCRKAATVRLNEHLEHECGMTVFQHACKMGLEGIVSKRPGRAIAPADRWTGSSLSTPQR